MHVHNDMHVAEFPCMRSTTLLTLSTPCQLLEWIYNLYERNLICACMFHLLLYMFLLQIILSSMQLLFFLEFLLQHMQLILCSFLGLRAVFMSCFHLITSISKADFPHEWIYFEFAAWPYLYAVNNLPLAFITCRCDAFCSC